MRDSVDFASIRVDFSLQPDVATATCELLDLEDGVILPETDCKLPAISISLYTMGKVRGSRVVSVYIGL